MLRYQSDPPQILSQQETAWQLSDGSYCVIRRLWSYQHPQFERGVGAIGDMLFWSFLVYVHLVLFPLVFYQKDIDLHKIKNVNFYI